MKMPDLLLVTVSFFFVNAMALPATADSKKYTPTQDRKAELGCTCVLATSACEAKIFDDLADKPRQTWSQDIFLKAGVTVDLSSACWRKRDDDKGGKGLCCSILPATDEAKNIRFFNGVLK